MPSKDVYIYSNISMYSNKKVLKVITFAQSLPKSLENSISVAILKRWLHYENFDMHRVEKFQKLRKLTSIHAMFGVDCV